MLSGFLQNISFNNHVYMELLSSIKLAEFETIEFHTVFNNI